MVRQNLSGAGAETVAGTSKVVRQRPAGLSQTQYMGRPREQDVLATGLSRTALQKRVSGASRVNRRDTLGAGFVSIPALPSKDPMQRLMADPVVPPAKRYCSRCQEKVEEIEGTCGACGHAYRFTPTMRVGDCIGNQYEVRGVIAHGAMGWIYLAWDQVLSRWVVLKALMHGLDEEGLAMALAERRYLAALKHPNIVGIYNFARQGDDGFIVMEYIGGKTIRELREERGVLPAAEAIAYIAQILPAFSYLHRSELLYCDFKLENFMLEESQVKLIDMGCVRRADDTTTGIYGTRGYAAPEASEAPSVASDLYTLGRTLAIMVAGFDIFGEFEHRLPPAADIPVFAKYPALYAFLQKATHAEAHKRFQSADDMADQLLGVLRKVVAGTSPPRYVESSHFSTPSDVVVSSADLERLRRVPHQFMHALRPDVPDLIQPAVAAVQALRGEARIDAFRKLVDQNPESEDLPILLAESHVLDNQFTAAERVLDDFGGRDPDHYRVIWVRGVLALGAARFEQALDLFRRVASDLPGELAPKFAMATASELLGEFQEAAHWYRIVSAVDPAAVGATMGLARALQQLGDISAARETYRKVPTSSNAFSEARGELVKSLLLTVSHPPGMTELKQASEIIGILKLEGAPGQQIRLDLFSAALSALRQRRVTPLPDDELAGIPVREADLLSAIEKCYRALARHEHDVAKRTALVDQANRVRPFSWL